MATLPDTLRARFAAAIAAALGDALADTDPIITAATNPQFGDFQANVAMGLGKRLGRKPREVAEAIVARLQWQGVLAQPPDIAGPGFINLRMDSTVLADQVGKLSTDTRLGIIAAAPAQTVVIDYGSPNLAKEMHVGHLRSLIIGDALGRVLDIQGHRVIRHNHIGDWGTQFGMLLEHLIDTGWDAAADHSISDLNALYQDAKKRDDSDPAFAERARRRVVLLQQGDDASRRIWHMLIDESVRHMNEVVARLGVQLTDADLKPESFYNDRLMLVCEELEKVGVARVSEGALCVFVEGANDPLVVRKSDGGFGYAATDLAAVRHRVLDLHAQRVVYVVDARQRDHFAKFFAAAGLAGWLAQGVKLEHVAFGTILGKDRKPFKTRQGGTVRLADVLDEAEKRAFDQVSAKNPDLPEDERRRIAHVVGIGALKYADLSNDRIKDYIFDWDRMLALDGNTAPYLQYSYTRIRSIFRKVGEPSAISHQPSAIRITDPAERALGLKLLGFASVVDNVAHSLEPHRLCTYLYELAAAFHQFYEQCPVLAAPDAAMRASRLALCDLVGRVLRQGLALLGIDVPERM